MNSVYIRLDSMDFDQLVSDPVAFVNELVQTSDLRPDFGISQSLLSVINSHPGFTTSIPMIASAGDLQLYPPFTFCRLRCTFNLPVLEEAIGFRIFHGGRFHTAIVPTEFPPDCPVDLRQCQTRRAVAVSSIAAMTEWLRREYAGGPREASPRLGISNHIPGTLRDVFEIPFIALVRVLFALPNRPGVTYDFYGFFEPAAPFQPRSGIGDGFQETMPPFIAFAGKPIWALYRPTFFHEPRADELRGHLLEIIGTILEPLQAELLLLWLVGRARSHDVLQGLISLNFTGCERQTASGIARFLTFFCTTLNVVEFTVGNFNDIELRPSRTEGEFKPTALSAGNETRILIDETMLDEGVLSARGLGNMRLMQEVIDNQTYEIDSEGDFFDVKLSFAVIVLSAVRSMFKCTISVPIGAVHFTDLDIDQQTLAMLRWYVEEARMTDWALDPEGQAFAVQQVEAVIRADRSSTMSDLQLLMSLHELVCVSFGAAQTTPEIWERVLQLFASVVALDRPP
jgi:hypothetical protein